MANRDVDRFGLRGRLVRLKYVYQVRSGAQWCPQDLDGPVGRHRREPTEGRRGTIREMHEATTWVRSDRDRVGTAGSVLS